MAEPSTRNITRVFRSATEQQVADGLAWYDVAQATAQTLANQFGVSFEAAAGVIAALSPMQGWGQNVAMAKQMLASNGTLDRGGLGSNLAKARAIVAGADPMVVLAGLKVRAFYAGIVSGGREGVTIDRHAWSVATNVRWSGESITDRKYRDATECYRRAAKILSRETGTELTAAQVQAITWVTWRHRYWAPGAFDQIEEAA